MRQEHQYTRNELEWVNDSVGSRRYSEYYRNHNIAGGTTIIMSREHLATYLNDHLAGSFIAVEILEHLESEATDLIQDLGALKAEIEADRRQLKELLDRLGISESRVRKVTSWIAEQVTEAKFEADDESRGTLRRLERLESLALGIDGKSALWQALKAAAELAPELRQMDYEQLVQRAQQQRSRVEMLRVQAARVALPPLS
ncbi:MAG: hypothetical protein DMG14_12380 [Acidobacteria bacterium]|nr:MAG: hypothetical protein DMG14_12380 [Acidobacteriota bacterium]